MATGVVKWFNENKGFGFIKPNVGTSDVFVHRNACEKSGITLMEGDHVSYDLEERKGKTSAVNLKLVG